MNQPETPAGTVRSEFTSAEMGAFAHLYRAEVYRSTTWRTRLDNSTNWAVVTTGLALSISFSDPASSPLPLVLVGLLVSIFLLLEARRYRYFNVWRARARLMETDFYAPMLLGKGTGLDGKWNTLLANDLKRPLFHISYTRAVGRRLRKNYIWIFAMQVAAYYGKLLIHPTPLNSLQELFDRAAIGPVPGLVVIAMGIAFHGGWVAFALFTLRREMIHRKDRENLITIA